MKQTTATTMRMRLQSSTTGTITTGLDIIASASTGPDGLQISSFKTVSSNFSSHVMSKKRSCLVQLTSVFSPVGLTWWQCRVWMRSRLSRLWNREFSTVM